MIMKKELIRLGMKRAEKMEAGYLILFKSIPLKNVLDN